MKKKEIQQKKQHAGKTCRQQAGVRDTRGRDAGDTNARNGKTRIGNRRKNFKEPNVAVASAVHYDLLPTTYDLSSKLCNNASIPAKTVHFGSPRFSSVQFGTAWYSLVQPGTGAKMSQDIAGEKDTTLKVKNATQAAWQAGSVGTAWRFHGGFLFRRYSV